MRQGAAPGLLWLAGIVLCAGSGNATTRGTVVDIDGVAIEDAAVRVAGDLEAIAETRTDALGRFVFPELSCPCRLMVLRRGFEPATIDVDGDDVEPTITLVPFAALTEEILVAGAMPTDQPVWVASAHVEPANSNPEARSVTEVAATVPGVAENGQGGLFQVTSVRGMSARRVLTMISGVRIEGFRRAGVPLSFLDPFLIEGVDVVRGPVSTWYGNGALAGVLEVVPAVTDHWGAGAGFDSRGDESSAFLSGGWTNGSIAVAHREADNSETPDGTELNTHFRQLSATGDAHWSLDDGKELSLLSVVSRGDDIGKDNVDFPRRTTNYPEERHALLKLNLGAASWSARSFVHDNDLETLVVEPAGRYEVHNEATDFGGAATKDLVGRGRRSIRFGIDLFGRSGVSARERDQVAYDPLAPDAADVPIATRETVTLDDGRHQEAGWFGSAQWRLGATTIEAGGRGTSVQQSNAGGPTVSELAWDGFLGGASSLSDGWDVYYGLSTGSRFPDLGERFFTGTTPRGRIVGVPDLEPEHALNGEVGVRYRRGSWVASAHVFRNEINDYIEHIDLTDDVSTFRNLTRGTLEGVELQGRVSPLRGFTLGFGAHVLEGRDDGGAPLADVPSDRLTVTARQAIGRWSAEATLEHRWAKDDPGSGEVALPSAEVASLQLRWDPREALGVTLYGRNLLDRTYQTTADRKATPAAARSAGITLRWRS